jgi:hypothetical protein|nr:MAG TPA: hypothetical protein [Caudoviricetes sp.]
MGEYYNWVNVDKKEYICPADFNSGSKFREIMHKDSAPLHALHTLLSGKWKGDRVLWLGDECLVSNQFSNNIIQILYDQSVQFGYLGEAFNMIYESYKNISGLFKEAEEEVREEIGYYLAELKNYGKLEHCNEYGVNLEHPFEGLFIEQGKRYTYIINHTKKIYYLLDETQVFDQSHMRNEYLDPLLVLLGYGRVSNHGEWLGDIIGVSNQRPEGYVLLKELEI